jgi:LPXTG-motif cell wall-anchored protein
MPWVQGYLTHMAQVAHAKVTAERRPLLRDLRPLLVLGGFATLWWILMTGSAQAALVASPAGEQSGTGTPAAPGGASAYGVLPQTGASATMLLFLVLGLAALFGGIYLVRQDKTPPRRRDDVSRSSNHS